MSTVRIGFTKEARATFTRPNDTTTYTAGDVMAATGTSSPMTFLCGKGNGGAGYILGANLIDGANQSLKLDADLFLFSEAPATYGNDNAVFTPTDAELLECVGVIHFASGDFKSGDATAGAGGNAYCLSDMDRPVPFVCETDDNALYGVLVARNAYIPIASSPFYVNLQVLQDPN